MKKIFILAVAILSLVATSRAFALPNWGEDDLYQQLKATFNRTDGTGLTIGGINTSGASKVTGALYADGGLDRSTAAALAIGATNASSVVITPNTTVTGTLNDVGNFSVNTTKFTVAAASGNTVVLGTLAQGSSGQLTSDASGNFATTGTITATANSITAGTTVTAGTGVTATTGNITASAGAVSANTTVTAGTGLTVTTGNAAVSSGNLTVSGALTYQTNLIADGMYGPNSTVLFSSSTTLQQANIPYAMILKAIGNAAEGSTLFPKAKPGQEVVVRVYAAGPAGTWSVKPDSAATSPVQATGWNSVTFNAVGQSATFVYFNDTLGWILKNVSSSAATALPTVAMNSLY